MSIIEQTNLQKHIAVILINYNSLGYTNDCIAALSLSTIKPFIIVVDNSSSNAGKLEEELIAYNYGFHLIKLPVNIGFGKANNVAIKWAQDNYNADFFFILNNDTIVQPNTLENLIIPFCSDNNIGITTCKIVYAHNNDIVWYGGGELNYRRGKTKNCRF